MTVIFFPDLRIETRSAILNRNEPVRKLGSLWSQTESQTRLRFTEPDESKSLRFRTKPNRDRSKSRLKPHAVFLLFN